MIATQLEIHMSKKTKKTTLSIVLKNLHSRGILRAVSSGCAKAYHETYGMWKNVWKLKGWTKVKINKGK